jgi:glycosyltransferase involved in cell wall biosynthesis
MYDDNNVVAVIVVSEDSKSYLKYSFPNMPVYRVHNSINPNPFSFQLEKKKQITFILGKHITDTLQIINILRRRHTLDDFQMVGIQDMPQAQVAQIMRESMIFLSLGYQEGFSLPAAEAMACGCVVIGYHGEGGREFFNPEFCYPITTGDVVSFAKTVEMVAAEFRKNRSAFAEKRSAASTYISESYTRKRQEEDVLRVWTEISGDY